MLSIATLTVCTVQQKITADLVTPNNLTLRLDEVQTTYRCLLSTGVEPVSVNVTSGETVTVIVLPGMMYTIGCVGYDKQGKDLCVEAKTSILTREQ